MLPGLSGEPGRSVATGRGRPLLARFGWHFTKTIRRPHRHRRDISHRLVAERCAVRLWNLPRDGRCCADTAYGKATRGILSRIVRPESYGEAGNKTPCHTHHAWQGYLLAVLTCYFAVIAREALPPRL